MIEKLNFPIRKFSKGHNSVVNVGRVVFFFSAHCLIRLYICTKFHENI